MRWISALVGVSLLVGGLGAVTPSAPDVSAAGDAVFRPYGGAGGLKDEFEPLVAEHRGITKLVTIGQTVRGEDIVALKVSRDARRIRDGRRPATLYLGAQHAREWITPEMVRRLAHHVPPAALPARKATSTSRPS
jgi:hypothetical protein